MGICSKALYSCLKGDLSHALPTLPFDRLGHGNVRGAIWPGIKDREVASVFLLDSLLKKFEDDKSTEADEVALAKFLAANSSCKRSSAIDVTDISEIQSIALGEFREFFYNFWFNQGSDYFFNTSDVLEGMRTGPGASVGVTGTSHYHKVAAGPMTGTNSHLFSLYKGETARTTLWDETEKIRSNHFGGFKQVTGSRLSYVPKSKDVSRTICTEPLLNMLFQQGLGTLFTQQLRRRYGIDLQRQAVKNRELCRIGSITGEFGTIDLSSASDTISLDLLNEILPSYVLGWIKETRSPVVTLPHGELLDLHMVSSMGNGFTFPLQTILFSCVVLGVYSALGIKVCYPRGDKLGNWSVFGDDIIVRREAYDLVVNLLTRIGFQVNRDKSYNTGPFRESCGADFWHGYNVRGVYCQSLKTKQDVYSLINRLIAWSANHGVLLPLTIHYLTRYSGVKHYPVPVWESDVSGIKVPFWLVAPSQYKRNRKTGSILYSRYLTRPLSTCLLSIGDRLKMRHQGKDVLHNPSGVLFSALGGYLRDGNLASRNAGGVVVYQKRWAVAPCWDYYSTSAQYNLTELGWHRWKSYCVYLNLDVDSSSGSLV